MIYVVIYQSKSRWQYAAHSKHRDEALGALLKERLLHPEREYEMQVCAENVFDALYSLVA